MERGCLGENCIEKIWSKAVKNGVAEFMIYDVTGLARIDAALLTIKPIKLECLALTVVIGILAISGCRDKDKAIAVKAPLYTAAKTSASLKKLQGVLNWHPTVLVPLEPRY
jgi:hypothetical protein